MAVSPMDCFGKEFSVDDHLYHMLLEVTLSKGGDYADLYFEHPIENWVVVEDIAEMNIADNHLNFWNKIVEVANDPWPYGTRNLPSLVFEDVVVSGV